MSCNKCKKSVDKLLVCIKCNYRWCMKCANEKEENYERMKNSYKCAGGCAAKEEQLGLDAVVANLVRKLESMELEQSKLREELEAEKRRRRELEKQVAETQEKLGVVQKDAKEGEKRIAQKLEKAVQEETTTYAAKLKKDLKVQPGKTWEGGR